MEALLSASLNVFIYTPSGMSLQHFDLCLMFPGLDILRKSGTASWPSGMLLPPSGMPCLEAKGKWFFSVFQDSLLQLSLNRELILGIGLQKSDFFFFLFLFFLIKPFSIMMFTMAVVHSSRKKNILSVTCDIFYHVTWRWIFYLWHILSCDMKNILSVT